MIITLEEYNTVIDGVRVQLDLMRRFQKELEGVIQTKEALREYDRTELLKARQELESIKQQKIKSRKITYGKSN